MHAVVLLKLRWLRRVGAWARLSRRGVPPGRLPAAASAAENRVPVRKTGPAQAPPQRKPGQSVRSRGIRWLSPSAHLRNQRFFPFPEHVCVSRYTDISHLFLVQ